MEVQLDNVWASPSTLHGRVTVWVAGGRGRHKFDVHVPLDTIPVEAIQQMLNRYLDTEPREETLDLFA